MPRFAFRYCPFHHAIKPILGCDMAYIGPWNGPFRNVKWCFLQSGEMALKHKVLLFNGLHKTLKIRVFAVDGESAQIRAYFLGYSGKLRRKKRNVVIIWKWGILGTFGKKRMAFIRVRKRSQSIGIRLSGGLLRKTVVYCFVVEQTLYYYWDYKGGRSARINSGEQGLYDLWGRLFFDISS